MTQAISPVGCCLARDGQRLGMSTKRDAARPFGLGIFCGGRYRTRTATTTTAACGRNREELLGQRSDFSRPRQGAEEKSANATRKAMRSAVSKATVRLCLARGGQPIGTSAKKDAADFSIVRTAGTSKGRVSPWRWCPAFCFASPYILRFGSIAAYVRTQSVRTYAGKKESSGI